MCVVTTSLFPTEKCESSASGKRLWTRCPGLSQEILIARSSMTWSKPCRFNMLLTLLNIFRLLIGNGTLLAWIFFETNPVRYLFFYTRLQIVYNRYVQASSQKMATFNLPTFEAWKARVEEESAGDGKTEEGLVQSLAMQVCCAQLVLYFSTLNHSIATFDRLHWERKMSWP